MLNNANESIKTVIWTVAGSDNSGGAGIQADLATFNSFGLHGCSIITALTAQNNHSVSSIYPSSVEHFSAEINSLKTDFSPAAIKIGMLGSAQCNQVLIDFLKQFSGPVVWDPVLKSSSGDILVSDNDQLLEILSQVTLVTPNISELEQLCGINIHSNQDLTRAAKKLCQLGAQAVLVKGGHLDPTLQANTDVVEDFFYSQDACFYLSNQRLTQPHNHGTGCVLSSAIAAAMATGLEVEDALVVGRAYLHQGLIAAKGTRNSQGAVNHSSWPKDFKHYPRLYPLSAIQRQPYRFASTSGQLGLYPVVPTTDWIEKLLPLGIKTIQLRNKDLTGEALSAEIKRAVQLSEHYQARLFINDYWQLAIEHSAYGVHLGQEDINDADLKAISDSGLRLGLSTHSYCEIARAHGIAPSYIAFGPIYPTTTKVMKFSQQGLPQLQTWTDLTACYPGVAIGGINIERAKKVLTTGIGSVAMVTAITEASDYKAVVKELLALF